MTEKSEIKDEFIEDDPSYKKSQLSISLDLGNQERSGSNEPEDNSVMAVKAEIKEEFFEGDPIYIERQLSTSLDLGDIKNEADEYNSGFFAAENTSGNMKTIPIISKTKKWKFRRH
ncbi:uncharacterized protein [Diabrotica undecimpunctata]|uniref:uncharacterized protein isoform X2 n=1 Tax=Diabrotica undecimpunctata TaxID=50387 RepID=UPI003B63B74D